jgi:cytochrome c biogenesis protein CcdA
MFALITLIVSVGLADSIDPAMIVPALHFASRPRPGRRIAGFAVGVFSVNVAGGLAIAVGPGRFLLRLAPHPGPRLTHGLELVGAGLLFVAAVALWRRRPRRDRSHKHQRRLDRASPLVGATIALVELPTAVPYFLVITALNRSHTGIAATTGLLALYQLLYLAPVIAIAILSQRAFRSHGVWGGDRLRALLWRYESQVMAAISLVAGLVLVVLGRSAI